MIYKNEDGDYDDGSKGEAMTAVNNCTIIRLLSNEITIGIYTSLNSPFNPFFTHPPPPPVLFWGLLFIFMFVSRNNEQ
jgi:hypothetical protein